MNKKKYSSLSVMFYFFKVAFKCRPSYPILLLLTIIVRAVMPLLSIVFPSLIIAELTIPNMADVNIKQLILLIGSFTLSELVLSMLNTYFEIFMGYNENMVTKEFKYIAAKKMMKMRYYHLESPEVLDQISKGLEGLSGYGNRLGGFQSIINNFITISSSALSLVGIVYIIAQINIVLIIALLAIVIVRLLVQSKLKTLDIKAWEERKRKRRENDYYSSLLVDFKYGKDIRLYDCKDLLIEKNKEYIEDTYNYNKRLYGKFKILNSLNYFLGAINIAMTYGYVAYYFIKGKITIAQYSLYAGAISNFVARSYDIFNSIMNIRKNTTMMSEFVRFMDIEDKYVNGEKHIDLDGPLVIEFKNVSFSYPDSKDVILKNINYKIDFKKKVSIVGENGAGKTTFIKLLMRLYDPSEGIITLNGIDIKEYDIKEYYGLFSVVFQDFQLIGFTLGENIASCDTYDENHIENILKDVDFTNKLEELEGKLSTSMLKYFDEKGIELSGGESQKVAIARALYKNAGILILDEPTAALDPLAEYEIYNQFDKMTNNKTTIYISHRLSSCRFCDEIVVLDDGKIVQIGHHDKLILNKNGKYYQMFKAQAKYYQDNNVEKIIADFKI